MELWTPKREQFVWNNAQVFCYKSEEHLEILDSGIALVAKT
jgi:hypothetical protein